MFDKIATKSHEYLQNQIDELKDTCEKDSAVAEMVKYIVAYSDQMAYCGGDEDARIGRQIIQHIWQINGMDFSSMGNRAHFDPSWARELNSFIGNFVYDDAAFDFVIDDFDGTITFKYADDNGRWLQDPMVIVEAAKANRAYYKMMDGADVFTRIRGMKADSSKVLDLAK